MNSKLALAIAYLALSAPPCEVCGQPDCDGHRDVIVSFDPAPLWIENTSVVVLDLGTTRSTQSIGDLMLAAADESARATSIQKFKGQGPKKMGLKELTKMRQKNARRRR